MNGIKQFGRLTIFVAEPLSEKGAEAPQAVYLTLLQAFP